MNKLIAIAIALATFFLLPGIGLDEGAITVVGALLLVGFIMGCVCTSIWMTDSKVQISHDETEQQVGGVL